jgi:tRNA dimethylallyltransferase
LNSNASFNTSDRGSAATLPHRYRTPVPRKKKKVIIISGPTAVGKTKMGLQMAHVLGGEIVSADSCQVYRGMDVGTAKSMPTERGSIRHHLIDSRDLDESFNVVDFYSEAIQAFHEIFARDHVPIIVGGTGFYIHTLIYGPPRGPAANPDLRRKLEEELNEKGSLVLYDRLKILDPEYAQTITFRDRQKIVRALEIMTLTNQKVSFFERSTDPMDEYDFRCWFLYMPKEFLYPRIDDRCERMMNSGLIDEVARLDQSGLRQNSSASMAIGYRQALSFLDSSRSPDDKEKFLEEFKRASRRYAKRQFTWFRKEPLFRWINLHSIPPPTALEMIIQDYEHS